MKNTFFLLLIVTVVSVLAQVGTTERISRGAPLNPNGDAGRISISQTGRYIVYESLATNVVGEDTNGARDIFLYDLLDESTEIISITGANTLGNDDSFRPDVSGNGRFVVFMSAATNLVPADTNGVSDIFVRDRQTQTTFRVSVTTGGVQANGGSSDCAISDNGQFVAFVSSATNLVPGDTNGVADAFLIDLTTGEVSRLSVSSLGAQANGGVSDVVINSSGEFVAFSSSATNLVPNDTNGASDVFLRNLQNDTTTLVSRSTAGVIGNGTSRSPSINNNGDRVAFRSLATNLVAGDSNGVDDVFVRFTGNSTTVRASTSSAGTQGNGASLGAAINPSLDSVVFQSSATNLVNGDTNAQSDVFLKNLSTGETRRLSISTQGTQANGASTEPAFGFELVVFLSTATNLVSGDVNGFRDGFGRYTSFDYTWRATSTGWDGNGSSTNAFVSDLGRHVAFASSSTNLVEGDANGDIDVFLVDLYGFFVYRASVTNAEGEANGDSSSATTSADGRYVAFASQATNLVVGDTNAVQDIFVRDILGGSTRRVSISTAGAQSNQVSSSPSISANGRYVVFQSAATNLVVGDTNAQVDVFVHDLQSSQTSRVSINNSGQQGNQQSSGSRISDDGNFVVFSSFATNLVTGDTNNLPDIFVRDRAAGTTERVSLSSGGAQANDLCIYSDISGDGSRVAFSTAASNLVTGDTNGVEDVFVRNRANGTTTRVSVSSAGAQANGGSLLPVISGDGLSVAFSSFASNLVPVDTNGNYDVFVRSISTNTTRRASLSTAGEQGDEASGRPSVSADGLAVAFESSATNFSFLDRNDDIDIYLNDARILSDTLTRIRGIEEGGGQGSVQFSDNIHYVLRPGVTLTSDQAPIELVGAATSLVHNPTRLEFAVEFHSTSSTIRQTLEMYNFDTNAYELVDTRQSTTSDSVTVVVISSNPGRFVDANGLMRTRLKYKASGPVLIYPWRTRLDHIRWTVFN
jgi:hypothetical protein